jgi:putative peptidoglycan lipid II flippase
LVGHAIVEIVARAFYALHDTRTPVLIGILAMLANIALSLSLMWVFGELGWMRLGGLALANSVATSAEMVVLLYLIRKRLAGLEGGRLISALWRMGLGCLVMLASLAAISGMFSTKSAWLISGVSIALGGAVYSAVTLLLRSEEPLALLRGIRNRIRNSP